LEEFLTWAFDTIKVYGLAGLVMAVEAYVIRVIWKNGIKKSDDKTAEIKRLNEVVHTMQLDNQKQTLDFQKSFERFIDLYKGGGG